MAGPHYVTRYLVGHFKGDQNLFELDKSTGKIEPRSENKAGAEVDIWPEDIERGQMQEWDNDAHRVLQAKVMAKEPIILTTEERATLNKWLFIYVIRSPANRELCRRAFNSGAAIRTTDKYTFTNHREIMESRKFVIAEARDRNPEFYEAKAGQWGRKALENELIRRWNEQIFLGKIGEVESPKGLFHFMLRSGGFQRYLKHVRGMKWTWLRSEYDFVIGDNPYCRCCSFSGGVNFGIGKEALEVFFPLTRHLRLWMHRRKRRTTELKIDGPQTQELNRRQIQSAVAKAWGPSMESLSPKGSVWTRSPIR